MRHRGPARRASAKRLASLLDGSDARGAVRPSGREWQGSQPGQSASELVFPRPMPWEMQYRVDSGRGQNRTLRLASIGALATGIRR